MSKQCQDVVVGQMRANIPSLNSGKIEALAGEQFLSLASQ